jgi:hypothetical protein
LSTSERNFPLRHRLSEVSLEAALIGLALLGALAFYLVNAAHYGHLPLRIEENEWPPMARAVHAHGKPEFPWFETHKVRLAPDLSVSKESYLGLWHPPLYLYVLGAAEVVLGTNASYTLRGVGVLSLLVSCLLLFVLARELMPRRWRLLGALASVLLLVHPYAIQGSAFLDIDTGMYAPIFLLFLWSVVRLDRADSCRRLRALVFPCLTFAVLLWTKMPTALVLVPILLVYWLIRVGLADAVRRMIVVVGLGAGVFFATYAIYTTVAHLPFSYTFHVTFGEKGNRLFFKEPSQAVKQAFDWHVAWFTPALLLLNVGYGIFAARRWWRTRAVSGLDLVWAFGVSVWVTYAFISPQGGYYQGKYAFPAIAPLAFAGAALVVEHWPARHDLRLLAVAAVAAVLAAYVMPDLLTGVHYEFMSTQAKLAVVLGTVAAMWIAVGGIPGRGISAVGVLLVCLAIFAAQSIRSYRSDTSPLFPVTDTQSFRQSASYINGVMRPGDIALVSKDLGFYVKGKVIDGQQIALQGDAFEARALRKLSSIRVVGTDSFGPFVGPLAQQAIAACFRPPLTIGSSVIYTRKSHCV